MPGVDGGGFAIETEIYSGPLDLLIDLIEKRKLLINDISLAAVTDDYMRYVAALEQNHIEETADFVVLASTLLLIKSKSLLPILELTESEEQGVEDLERRLRLYQIFRNAGKIIETSFGTHLAFERRFVSHETPLFILDQYTHIDPLKSAILDVINNLPRKMVKPKVHVRKVVSLEDMIEQLKTRIEREMTLRFKDFTGDSTEKHTVIVGFLAVLEMVKQGMIIVNQAAHFDDIHIERESSAVPKYF